MKGHRSVTALATIAASVFLLTGVPSVAQATIVIPSECDFCSVTQGGWSAPPAGKNPGTLLNAYFAAQPAGFEIVIGGTETITFESAAAIRIFLPGGGKPGVLTDSFTNPVKGTDTGAGVFASQVLALTLNVALSDADLLEHHSLVYFGDLFFCRTGGTWLAPLGDMSIRDVLELANQVLGGDTSALPEGWTVSDLNKVVDLLNNAFVNCEFTEFSILYLCRFRD